MKLFILSDPNSIHTKRWVSSLSDKGVEIFLFGIGKMDDEFYGKYKNISVFTMDLDTNLRRSTVEKFIYLSAINKLKKKIKEFQPDILHAHYASSYGLLGALTGFHPFIISVWGSDVYSFPKISFLHKAILKFNLSKTDYLLSTSTKMATETKKYTCHPITITPFGVDLELFKKRNIVKKNKEFIIGTVKTLDSIYRIDILIKSFNIVLKNNPTLNIKLVIIGDGPDKKKLQLLAQNMGIGDNIYFLGRIDNLLLPEYYNSFSVFVALSDSESFGVVAIEAMACECPVIASNADGFTEVISDGETGYIVPKRDIEETSVAIQKIIDDSSLGEKLGKNGRERVKKLYDWNKNVDHMIQIYNTVSSK